MPRRARLSIPGVSWHIIQRGNSRAVCFYAERDYQFYLHYLKEFAEQFGCAVHAYVLMTNHVHLLLTPHRSDSAALLMKHLGQRYVHYINRTYRRSGTLWEGRFRSCLMQSEDYVLACYRYIELNPVRAGMVTKPQDYRWSSYHRNGLGKGNPIITPHDEYRRLGATDEVRRAAYRTLFWDHLDAALVAEIRQSTNGISSWEASGSSNRSRQRWAGVWCREKRDGRAQRTIRLMVVSDYYCNNRGLSPISLHTHP